ncbi:signal transduction histidine kinase [Streptacidiphilus sp. MAP12-16]|uniref:sensor histidine kinase n=1 Tax=Streptacidiphilus sp. MAP12-16 TaxID=3156300 RepID=UPI00351487F3
MYISIAVAAAALAVALALGIGLRRTRRADRQRQKHHEQLQAAQAQLEQAHLLLQNRCVQLAAERDELEAVSKQREQELQQQSGEVFVNLALRTLGLVERQLGLLEGMEGAEADSARLDQLYRLDHLATRMRRNGENMLLLGGATHHRPGQPPAPTLLLDVLRAAVSEIERYERVHLTPVPQLWVRPDVAEDLSHLFAELLDNGTAFSPPTEPVSVAAWQLDSGELMVSLVDRGIGLPDELLWEANARLASGSASADENAARTGRSMGLQVVTVLARRHGLRVQLRHSTTADGTTALIAVPGAAFTHEPVPEPGAEGSAEWNELVADAASQTIHPQPPVGGAPLLSAVPGPRSGGTRTGPAGLPKRVPGESGQRARTATGSATADRDGGPSGEAGRPGSAADELRRRLGGFQNGVRAAAPGPGEGDRT